MATASAVKRSISDEERKYYLCNKLFNSSNQQTYIYIWSTIVKMTDVFGTLQRYSECGFWLKMAVDLKQD